MKIKEIRRQPKHMTSIGGQALIEGIMMRGPRSVAVSIRKPNGEIETTKEDLKTLAMEYPIFNLPILRGFVGLIESLILGTRMLMYSAEFYEEEEELGFLERNFGQVGQSISVFLTVAFSIFMALGLFMALPTLITSFFKDRLKTNLGLNLLEGLVRIIIFLIYIYFASRVEDVSRVFEYHGAEHKSIHCYESGMDLTVENVKKFPILHPRCGTSFLFMVMIVSILVLSFFGWPSPLKRLLTRILLFPLIAGISYEINKLIGRSSSQLAYFLSYPGLMIQKLATVKEPSDDQIEVALEALREVLPRNQEEDLW